MSVVAIISACTDNAGLLLEQIDGKAIICHTYQSAKDTGLFSDICVITDNEEIASTVSAIEGTVLKVNTSADSSLELFAKAAITASGNTVVYINGTIPFFTRSTIEKLLEQCEAGAAKNIEAASVVQKMQDASKINDPRYVKATLNLRLFALYFSRTPIPYIHDKNVGIAHYEHISIYAFKKDMLMRLMGWPASPLERVEQVEALRLLENGVQVKMFINTTNIIELHSKEDIAAAEASLTK